MTTSIHQLLQKISYIEAEIEIQKQILFSFTDDEKNEMEKVIRKIAASKEEIQRLRLSIKESSPEEFTKLCNIEEAVEKFKSAAAEIKFTQIDALANGEDCSMTLTDGTTISCLIRATDEKGDYTVITLEGELKNISAKDVQTAD